MPSGEAVESPPRGPSRRRLWWTLGIFVTPFIAALVLAIWSDAEPPDVSDLAVVPSRIPEAENFYVQLMKLEDGLQRNAIVPEWEPDDLPADSPDRMPSRSQTDDYDDFIDFLAAGHGWTPSRLARWDAPLARLAVDCEVLATLERGQAPLPTKTWSGSGVSYQVGSRLCAAAGLYWQAGESRRAMEILELVHQLGNKMKASGGPLGIYQEGMNTNRQAIRNLERLALHEPDLVPEMFSWWQNQRGDEPAGLLADAIRLEYSNFSLNLDAICTGAPTAPMPRVLEFCVKSRILLPLVLKPNLTKTVYAGQVRNVIGWRELTWSQFQLRSGLGSNHLEVADLAQPVNVYGRFLIYESSGPFFVIWQRARYRSEVSVFEVSLALRLYHARAGRLPASLDELVPAYFPSVPLDHEDGAPIRYSREARAVWSVGERALQIVTPDQAIDRREIYCRLDFAAPPASADIKP